MVIFGIILALLILGFDVYLFATLPEVGPPEITLILFGTLYALMMAFFAIAPTVIARRHDKTPQPGA